MRTAENPIIPMNIIDGNLPLWPTVDLRYVILVILNLFLTSSEKYYWISYAYNALNTDEEGTILKLLFGFLLVTLLLLCFLFISIQLHLHGGPIQLHLTVITGGYSIPLTILLAFAIILKPWLFWLVSLIIVLTSAWHGKFWELFKVLAMLIFKHFLYSFALALQHIPPIVVRITCPRALEPVDGDDEDGDRANFALDAIVDDAQLTIYAAATVNANEVDIHAMEEGRIQGAQSLDEDHVITMDV